MYILIDDEKTLDAEIIIRDPDVASWLLEQLTSLALQAITTIGIDFDLGHPNSTGEDVLRYAFNKSIFPAGIQIVSLNPVGRKRIANLLEDYGYTTSDGSNFTKGK